MMTIKIRNYFALALTAIVIGAAGTAWSNTIVNVDDLQPTREHKKATRLITHFIGKYHYKQDSELDDELSNQIFDQFLESIDGNKQYLTRSDVDQFSKFRDVLDDHLEEANLGVPFEVFRLYRKRVDDRIDKAIAMLENIKEFDINEEYQFDRTDLDWALDAESLDEVWRKRVKNDVLSLKLAGKPDDEIVDTLKLRYERLRRRVDQTPSDDVFELFMNAYAGTIEPHTSYFSPRSSENFRIRMSLSLEGIGAVLQTEDEHTMVRKIVPGGPADLSTALHAGDKIVGVGQAGDDVVDVIGWRLDDVVELIRGKKGSKVTLEIMPKGSTPEDPSKNIEIVRDKINLEEQAAQKSIIDGESIDKEKARVGVITLPTFYIDFDAKARGERDYRSTTRDVRALLDELIQDGIEGLIIDLRGNGGGSLQEATTLTGLFIKSGPIVQVRDASGRMSVHEDPDPAIIYEGPLAVLVDRNSASASEIFAGAIQDYRRGLIIGEPTYGKGTVQNLIPLDRKAKSEDEGLGQLKLTMAQFFRINGGSTQHRGVIPDIVYPTAVGIDDHGERALDNALPWTNVQPATYAEFQQSYDTRVMRLTRENHQSRISDDPGFEYLVGEAKAISRASDQKVISLLEKRRIEERSEKDTERRTRLNAYRAALGLKPLEEGEEVDEEESTDDDVLLEEAARILTDFTSAIEGKTITATDQAASKHEKSDRNDASSL